LYVSTQFKPYNPPDFKNEINDNLKSAFKLREEAIDQNVIVMDKLHKDNPEKYPLIPLSDTVKGSFYKGIIGGKRKSKKRRSKKRKSKKRKSKKNKY
jgi:hypothetical protein